MSPAVTVIIPVYDRERFVREAIASVLAQTFGDFEVIIVDDGSTDETAAVVAAVGLMHLGRHDHRRALAAFARAFRSRANPIATAACIVWFTLNWQYLSRRAWGRRFVDWQHRVRGQWRMRLASS